MAIKKQRKCCDSVCIHNLKIVHLQQLKGIQSSKVGRWKWYHLSIKDVREGYIFCQKQYIKGYRVGPRSRAFRYNTLLITPPPPVLLTMMLPFIIGCISSNYYIAAHDCSCSKIQLIDGNNQLLIIISLFLHGFLICSGCLIKRSCCHFCK